jgi:hypothetical protein
MKRNLDKLRPRCLIAKHINAKFPLHLFLIILPYRGTAVTKRKFFLPAPNSSIRLTSSIYPLLDIDDVISRDSAVSRADVPRALPSWVLMQVVARDSCPFSKTSRPPTRIILKVYHNSFPGYSHRGMNLAPHLQVITRGFCGLSNS